MRVIRIAVEFVYFAIDDLGAQTTAPHALIAQCVHFAIKLGGRHMRILRPRRLCAGLLRERDRANSHSADRRRAHCQKLPARHFPMENITYFDVAITHA